MRHHPFIMFVILAVFPFFAASPIYGQSSDSEKDSELIFDDALTVLSPSKNLDENRLMVLTATFFVETPYRAGTLESIPERLIINLKETDCILFVETCLAFVRTLKEETPPTFDSFKDHVRQLRYRDGQVSGYDSRLHYTSEWIKQAEANHILREITQELGGVPLPQTFSYMTTHTQSYRQLSESNDMVRRVGIIERRLNDSGPYYYIPANKIKEIASQIEDGDIICFVSNVEGLDITHLGLACHSDNELRFFHASSKEKKVVLEKKTLVDYVKTGIRVLRINNTTSSVK